MAPCRNGTNRTPKGRCIALKREDHVLEQRQQCKLIPKQRSHKPRYRRTYRRAWNQGCKETTKPAKLSKEQLRRIAKVMHELHLPFPVSNERRPDIANEVLPNQLRCSIKDGRDSEEECWRDAEYPPEHHFLSIENASSRSLCWNQPPTCVAHLEIHKSLNHFEKICSRAQYLQIPSYWPVFDGTSWGPDHYLYQATSDSSGSETMRYYVPDPDCSVLSEGDSDAGDRENVKCEAGKVFGARPRGFWTFISALVSHRFDWHHQTRERALRRHRTRHVGYLDLNQTSHNYDIWPQQSIQALLSRWEQGYCSHELGWPSIFGRLITNVVATDMFPAKIQQLLHWPAPFDHLDCRRSMDEPLPYWMVLYGATYDEHGLMIHAHAPYFSPPQVPATITDWGWCSVSSSVVDEFLHIIHEEPNARGSLIATLSRIQGHCSHVLEKLAAWDGYEHAVSRILQA